MYENVKKPSAVPRAHISKFRKRETHYTPERELLPTFNSSNSNTTQRFASDLGSIFIVGDVSPFQGLFEIGDQILGVFNAARYSDHVIGNSHSRPLLRGEIVITHEHRLLN